MQEGHWVAAGRALHDPGGGDLAPVRCVRRAPPLASPRAARRVPSSPASTLPRRQPHRLLEGGYPPLLGGVLRGQPRPRGHHPLQRRKLPLQAPPLPPVDRQAAVGVVDALQLLQLPAPRQPRAAPRGSTQNVRSEKCAG